MTQKEKAIECMRSLDIYKPYIDKFKQDGTVCLFEGFGGFYIDKQSEPELFDKIKSFEEETGSLVYAVTHEYTEFGELYDFLCVSKYEEDWKYSVNDNVVFAYVWNKTDEWCSEYGSIGIMSLGGGIRRVS